MSNAYNALLSSLKGRYDNVGRLNEHLAKLPEIVIFALRQKLGIPDDAVEYGYLGSDKVYKKGEMKIGVGHVNFSVHVRFQVGSTTFNTYFDVAATCNHIAYQISLAGQDIVLNFNPEVDKDELISLTTEFGKLLKEEVDRLLIVK